MNPKMHNLTEKDHFEYAWRHFTVIADQRLKTFNFYIIMVAAGVAATLAAFEKKEAAWIMFSVGVLNMVCAVVFFLIDERSRRLVEIPKMVLIEFEEAKDWKLFRTDAALQKTLWHKITSYTSAFRLAFFSQFVFGLVVVVAAIMSMFQDLQESLESGQRHRRHSIQEKTLQLPANQSSGIYRSQTPQWLPSPSLNSWRV